MVIVIVVVAVIAAILLVSGAVYWLVRVMKQKESADLNRLPARRKTASGKQMKGASADDNPNFVNHAPAVQGIQNASVRIRGNPPTAPRATTKVSACLL